MVRLAVADENVPVVAFLRERVLGLSIVLWFWLWLLLTGEKVGWHRRGELVNFLGRVHFGQWIPYDCTTPVAVIVGHDFDARGEAVVRGFSGVYESSLASFAWRSFVSMGGFS